MYRQFAHDNLQTKTVSGIRRLPVNCHLGGGALRTVRLRRTITIIIQSLQPAMLALFRSRELLALFVGGFAV